MKRLLTIILLSVCLVSTGQTVDTTKWVDNVGVGYKYNGWLVKKTFIIPTFGRHASDTSSKLPAQVKLIGNSLYYTGSDGIWRTPTVGFVETDPVFAAHVANTITSTNISNWNTAYGWGNHASAGYLTSSSITGKLNISDTAAMLSPYLRSNVAAATYLTNITGKLSAGTNITLTGTGTSADPYVVNSSGGGGGGVTSFNIRTGDVVPVAGDYATLTETLTNKTISGASNTFSNIAQASVTNLPGDLAAKQNLLTNSSGLAGALSDETGTGFAVFGTSPTFTTQITTPLIYGSDASGGNRTSWSTSHAVKGKQIFGSNALVVDDVNSRVGIGTASPTDPLHVHSGSNYFKINPNFTSGVLARWFNAGIVDATLVFEDISGVGHFALKSGGALAPLQVSSLRSGTISINQATNGGATQYEAFRYANSSNYFQYYTESGVAFRGGYGFAAGSADMQFRLNGAQSISTGTEVLRLGGTASGGVSVVTGNLTVPSGSVGIGTTSPNASALLDVSSTAKGSRPFPSMTEAQRTALSSPVAGLHVYQTDAGALGEGVYVYKSTGWAKAY